MKKPYNIEEKKAIENSLYSEGYNLVAGIDEVGRGPLAGPVVCACVILKKDSKIEGVDDSKKLSAKKREELYNKILADAVCYSVEYVFEDEIDKINILNATKKCMEQCVKKMSVIPDILLVDAISGLNVPCKTKAIIHGDALSYTIGASSIIAKVERDRFMDELDKKYPMYGFAKNKGYGTKEHMSALREYGPSKVHRKTFLKFLGEGNE